MANNNPDPALQALQLQLSEMKAGFEAIVQQQNQTIANLANLATSQLQPPRSKSPSHADIMLRQFIKDPVQTHDRTNPQKPILAFDGSNYVEWEKAVDRTLQQAFAREKSFIEEDAYTNFDNLGVVENVKVAELLRNTLHSELLTIVESEGATSSKELFKTIRDKCKRSGRRHKIILVNRIIKFATDRSPASESWLARFCTIMTDVEKAKISVNELGGLLLQSLATAPPGVDSKNFDYSVSQPLDDKKSVPTLGEVTTVIQSALSKISPSGQLSPGTIPSDVEMSVQAIRTQQGTIPSDGEMSVQAMRTQQQVKYRAPHKRLDDPHQQSSTPQPKFSVEKATFYKGKGHSDSLLQKFGYACLYCRETGHWYADCNAYWEDVRHGRVDAPPANHNESGSRFLPPPRPNNTPLNVQNNGRIRKIDLPEANDGTILLDSGSTINPEDTDADGSNDD
ncbi:Dcp1p-Dcp2p decapping enzyme complex alpha subunit [Puccinia graminis f. sp. tritici]|uniref:Dcp1p-Dcp2p decapping enzyme complex alpha subunit n=1 Tax=Puccinia graminis f. sp. tritici TaxID=56615 RepID=A0A5B0SM31_PUCGR|nr:Dcp1p-Dcp2p decapping enzyme complex alpha subunit [Puccinia graminis f. sp. tritici]